MFELKNQSIDLLLKPADLQQILLIASNKITSQPFQQKVPVLGEVTVSFRDIITKEVLIVGQKILITQEIALHVVTKAALLPNMIGRLSIESSLTIEVMENAKAEYRILNFSWLEGPLSEQGKSLGLIKKVSSKLFQTRLIEDYIENQISKILSPTGLQKILCNLPNQFVIGAQSLYVANLLLSLHRIEIHANQLLIRCSLSFKIMVDADDLNQPVVKFCPDLERTVCQIKISQILINKLIRTQIMTINRHLQSSPIQLDNLEIRFEEGVIRILITPNRFVEDPVEIILKLELDPVLATLNLVDCQVSPNEHAGLLVRVIFKLVSGKIEDVVESHFPIDLREKFIDLVRTFNQQALPIKIEINEFQMIQLNLNEGNGEVDYRSQLILSPSENLASYLSKRTEPWS